MNEEVAQWLRDNDTAITLTSSRIRLADGSYKETNESFEVTFLMYDRIAKHKFSVLPNLPMDVLIGDELLRKMGFMLIKPDGFEVESLEEETGNEETAVTQDVPPVRENSGMTQELTVESPTDNCCVASSEEKEYEEGGRFVDKQDLTELQRNELENLLKVELKRFEDLKGCTNFTEHVIRMKSDQPVKQRYFPKNPKMCEVIHKQVEELIANGQIEPSSSAYASPVVLVKKKYSSWRMCIDYRKLNELSEKDAYPTPKIPSILNRLKEAKYVSAIDLKNGYWQIPIRADCRQFTAFTVPGRGLYQWRVMPFGLHSAPTTFQRLLDQLITHEFEHFAIAYLDDIIIFSKTFEEHLDHIHVVLRRLQEANLKINTEKSVFCKKELKYLGHVVGNGGIKTDPTKLRPLQS